MKMTRNRNPFDDVNDTITFSRESEGKRNNANPNNGMAGIKISSPSAVSASLFPSWLSNWMTISQSPHNPVEEDDESLYHDCLSKVDAVDELSSSSSMEDETTNLLANTTAQHHDMLASDSLSPLRQRVTFYNATSTNSTINSNSMQHRRRTNNLNCNTQEDINVANTLHGEPNPPNSHDESITSPLAQALATWLSPYADSAKRAGRKIFYFSEESMMDGETTARAGENVNLLGANNDRPTNEIQGQGTYNTVKFHPDYNDAGNEGKYRGSKRGFLSRVNSSPALMTTFSDEKETTARRTSLSGYNSIVLKDIDVQGENNDSDDGTRIHPWTKLLLLEELGTAWSWFVLLLPYVFMALAVLLDGDRVLKNTTVGPLWGNKTCAEMLQGLVPAPFGISVKGYFPVPFWFADGSESGSGSCTYPFELREEVGLLSHGNSAASDLTLSSNSSTTPKMISIVDARYRYLMSHGHAFTSGIISDVPATSQSLRGSVKFDNLSSNAVASVARGSVLVSAVVFQRQTPNNDLIRNATIGGVRGNHAAQTNHTVKQWSPVLILSSKRLDMICKLNGNYNEGEYEASSWNCSSRRIINAFFSLPNTAVLMGGDLRVDILLSHQKTHASLGEDLWLNERGGIMGADDDYVIHDFNHNFALSKADKILSSADTSHPKELLAELSMKSVYKLEHESIEFNYVVEATRIFALVVTLMFFCYWWWSMGIANEDSNSRNGNEEDAPAITGGIRSLACKLTHNLSRICKKKSPQSHFWFEDPWITFPERRYLFCLLCCLVMLQNPLLVYAFFHPSLYQSAKFRFAADSLSGMSVHGILFLWLCLVHGLRYHTADIARRRLDQHRRVLELMKATKHIAQTNDIEDDNNQWGGVRRYYQQYGDVDGGCSLALRLKHDINSDSFIEFILPKMTLLVIGTVASITVAASRFPMSDSSIAERAELNPDRFGSGSKVYAVSSIVQLAVIQIWCVFIVYTSFVTGERLRREPFLSTRSAQLAFRVLSSILLLGCLVSTALFYLHSINLIGNEDSKSSNDGSGNEISYDTSLGGSSESWDSKADILFGIIRRASTEIPYVGTASNIGPGKILYATACSLVVAFIFLPSSHFHTSKKEQRVVDEIAMAPADQYSKQTLLSDMDKRLQGKDKRFVVALARNTHTWRVFPLPTRSHGLMSQHTLKETLKIVGTFQLDCHFNMHDYKFGRGAIYKGRYIPVFCVEIACWLLEASWQAYYSPSEYSLNDWAPGRMRLDSIGLKLEHAIHDSDTDTHAFVASNVSEQVEGEEDSIIVVSFRGSASISNIKTDLSFRQVPLPEKIMSDVPAFSIRPGKPIAVDETLWDETELEGLLLIQDIFHRPSGKYTSWPTASTESAHVDPDQSFIIPTVSSGAKAIIRATPMARQALPCVHEGFLKNYSKVRHEIIAAILSVFKRQLDKSVDRSRHGGSSIGPDAQPLTLPKMYITGHSMGGTLAQLLALDLASNCEIMIEQPISKDRSQSIDGSGVLSKQSLSSLDIDDELAEESSDTGDIFWLGQKLTNRSSPTKKIHLRPPIAVYTYGQSRLGNNAFKTIYKKRVPHTFRVATEGDAITTMPTLGPFCGGIYRHAGLEVLLEEGCTGNILVGPTVVETLLRFTKVRTSMAAHSMDRYRESLESALGRDDLKEYYRGHGGKVRHDDQGAYFGNGSNLPSWVTSVKRSHDV